MKSREERTGRVVYSGMFLPEMDEHSEVIKRKL